MKNWVTTAEAVRLSGYHPVTLRKLLLSGKVKGRKWGPVWQVNQPNLLAYLRGVKKLGAKRGPKRRG
jgi:hypothetical protein